MVCIKLEMKQIAFRQLTALLVAIATLLIGTQNCWCEDKAPGFVLPNVRGGQYRYPGAAHRALLIAFLQTQPDWDSKNVSRTSVAMLLSMDRQYHNSGLDVLIIDETRLALPVGGSDGDRAKVPSITDLLNTSYDWMLSFPLLADSNGKVAGLFGIKEVPTLILVDQNGNIAQRWAHVPHPGTLAAGIQNLIGGPMANRPPARVPGETP